VPLPCPGQRFTLGGAISEPDHWDSAEQFMATIRVTLDHSAGQATRLVVICEAGGWSRSSPASPTRSA